MHRDNIETVELNELGLYKQKGLLFPSALGKNNPSSNSSSCALLKILLSKRSDEIARKCP